ncbi:MAG: Minf_1886 family protein [Phycisphaerae bacterium]
MLSEPGKTLQDLVKHLGRYPEEAFLFIREGLSYAADQIHGPETEAHQALHRYLSEHQLDWNDLIAQYHAGQLPESMLEVIDAAGGYEKLNRHVGGRELCWALRDYALKRWGIMARVVLESWGVRSTADFGSIIFAFIDFDMMRKQDEDSVDDFRDVYSFAEAFDEPFRAGLRNGNSGSVEA